MPKPSRGLEFELSVMRLIKQRLKSGNLGISPGCGSVYHHKAYHSRERGGSIVVDIALEVCRRGACDPFLVWIWECKKYSHSVPIDDVEEFHSKLQQIGADRTKGTIISTGTFQRASINYARCHGIGLVRVLHPTSMRFDLEAASAVYSDDIVALLSQSTPGLIGDAIGVAADGSVLLGFEGLLRYELQNDR